MQPSQSEERKPRWGVARRWRPTPKEGAGNWVWHALAVGVLAWAAAACAPPREAPPAQAPAEASTLTVFAAASLTDAFQAIGEVFEQAHPDTQLVFNFAASSALRTQLEEGAPADVVAFASEKEMRPLIAAGLVEAGAGQVFTANDMVVVVAPQSSTAVASLKDLAHPGVKVVMVAPGVPAGDYARRVIESLESVLGADFAEDVFANVVSQEDNVRQVLAKVQLGEADAGWVYRSDAQAAPELRVVEIPAEFNVRAAYPIAPLRAAENPMAAVDFVELVRSAHGQRLLEQGGFLPVGP
ncbi:MAG: molybdate ABC transporter substrate-binding protein [Anaerolineales bacterium]|nr:molybdate ABC transporter substrate-binding protein [Anaerolineales bacterium]